MKNLRAAIYTAGALLSPSSKSKQEKYQSENNYHIISKQCFLYFRNGTFKIKKLNIKKIKNFLNLLKKNVFLIFREIDFF